MNKVNNQSRSYTRILKLSLWFGIAGLFLAGMVPKTITVADNSAAVAMMPDDSILLHKVALPLTDNNGDGIIWTGDTIFYEFSVFNLGMNSFSGLSIDDPLLAVAPVCDIMMVAPGDTAMCTGFYIVTAMDADRGVVTNSGTAMATGSAGAFFDGSDDPTDPTSDSDPTVVDITCPGLACPSNLNYTIPPDGLLDITAASLGFPAIFELELRDKDGEIITDSTIIDCDNGMDVITYSVRHPCGTTCWGKINVEAKHFPEFESPCVYVPSSTVENHLDVRDSSFVTLNPDGSVDQILADTLTIAQLEVDSSCQDLIIDITSSVKHFALDHGQDSIDWLYDSVYYEIIRPDGSLADSGFMVGPAVYTDTITVNNEAEEGIYQVKVAVKEATNKPNFYTTNGPEGQVWVKLTTTDCIPIGCDVWCPSEATPNYLVSKEQIQDSLNSLTCFSHLEVLESKVTQGDFCSGEKIVIIQHSVKLQSAHDGILLKPILTQSFRIVQPIGKTSTTVNSDVYLECGDMSDPWSIFEQLTQLGIDSATTITPTILDQIRTTAAASSFPYIRNVHDSVDFIYTKVDQINHKLIATDSLIRVLQYYNKVDSTLSSTVCTPNETTCIPVWVLDTTIHYTLKEVKETTTDTVRVPQIVPLYDTDICGLAAKFEDDQIEECGGAKNITRSWRIFNWCGGTTGASSSQIVRVRDRKSPKVMPIADISIGINANSCDQTVDLPPVDASDLCSEISNIEWTVIGDGTIVNDQIKASLGSSVDVVAMVFDECGNMATDTFNVNVVDNVSPVAISKDKLNISLTGNEAGEGTTKVTAQNVNQGSHDNECSAIELCVIRDEDLKAGKVVLPGGVRWSTDGETIEFREDATNLIVDYKMAYNAVNPCYSKEYKEFIHDENGSVISVNSYPYVTCDDYAKYCCSDIGDSTIVALIVTDEAGNKSTSWSQINVEDKSGIGWSCNVVTITCDDVCEFNPPRPSYGGVLCDVKEVIEKSRRENLICGEGTLDIEWAALDSDGREISTTICSYPVKAKDGILFDPANIKWPVHYDGTVYSGINKECNGDEIDVRPIESIKMGDEFVCVADNILDVPVWCETSCALILSTYQDENPTGGCGKIIRHWAVIDWCTWRPNGGLQPDDSSLDAVGGDDDNETFVAVEDWTINEACDDCPKKSGEFRNSYFEYAKDVDGNSIVDIDGYYTFDQVIKLIDNDGPVIIAEDVVVTNEADLSSCTASGSASVTVQDFCYGEPVEGGLNVQWGIFDEVGFGTTANFTDLPIGEYFIDWTATDICGNRTTIMQKLTVADVQRPSPICLGTISVTTMDITGDDELPQAQIWANDYNFKSSDACSPVVFYFKDEAGNRHPSLTFGCEDIDNGRSVLKELKVYVGDESGNEDFCTVQVRIDDAGDHCVDLDQGGALIAGALTTEFGDRIETATVMLNNEFDNTTGIEGEYAFENNSIYEDYIVQPIKNDDHLNGVSTLDIVLIQRHILGIGFLDSPYKIIGADVNYDERVSALDLVQLRKLVLGLFDEFPNNNSWRFVDAKQEFDNVLSPFPYKESLELQSLLTNEMNQDFIGVKIGDVSGNAIANSTIAAGSRSTSDLTFNMSQAIGQSAGTVVMEVRASNFEDIAAFQLGMSVSDATIGQVEGGAIPINREHFVINDNQLTLAWTNDRPYNFDNDNFGKSVDSDQVLFYISLDYSGTSVISYENFRLVDDVLRIAAYHSDYEELGVQLLLHNDAVELENDLVGNQYELHQNVPNPFNDVTSIRFDLPQSTHVTLSIFDQSGKILYNSKMYANKGANSININRAELAASGILYYQLDMGQYTATRKMLVID